MLIPGKETLKSRMKKGEVVFGTFYKFGNPQTIELLGYSGFDFVLIDGEHSQYGFNEMQDMVRTANGVGMAAVCRVPVPDRSMVTHICEMGAQGVQVPNPKTVEEAKMCAVATRFPPFGNRGPGGSTRAARWGFTPADEFEKYVNEDFLCNIMIENLHMVDEMDRLCEEVPQLDMLFVGPGDLSDAIGKPGQMQDPQVLALAERIIKTAVKHGKIGGMFCATYADVERAIGWGAKFIAFSSELNILQARFKQVVSELHAIEAK